MLDFVFITKKNDTQSFSMTENERASTHPEP